MVVPNQNLFRIANENTSFAQMFRLADDIFQCCVRTVADLTSSPGMINLDLADVATVFKDAGWGMTGSGEAEGERRALDATEAAICNPMFGDEDLSTARQVLINVTGGRDVSLFEVDEAANRVREELKEDTHIIFASCFDEEMDGRIRVSVIATGIERA